MELEILRWIQSFHSPFLDRFFYAVTQIYSEDVIILLLPVIYWVFDKRLGAYLAHLFAAQFWLNEATKAVFNLPRPIGQPGVRTLAAETAPGASFPSGHSQGAASLFFGAAAWFRRRWLWLVSAVIVLLVALSRLYLGVHWPKDVVAGVALGTLVALLALPVGRRVAQLLPGVWPQALAALVVPFGLSFLHDGGAHGAAVLGVWSGLWLGQALDQRLDYRPRASWYKQGAKLVLGFALLFGVRQGLKLLLPEGYFFQYLRYLTMGLSVTIFAPWLFRVFKLEESDR